MKLCQLIEIVMGNIFRKYFTLLRDLESRYKPYQYINLPQLIKNKIG